MATKFSEVILTTDEKLSTAIAVSTAATSTAPSRIVGQCSISVSVGTIGVGGSHPAAIIRASVLASARLATEVTSTTRPVTRIFSRTPVAPRFQG